MVDVFGNFDGFVGFCDDDLTQKPKADLTADYANFTDTIGYDYQCPEFLPGKDS
jgi:hypothetical protein